MPALSPKLRDAAHPMGAQFSDSAVVAKRCSLRSWASRLVRSNGLAGPLLQRLGRSTGPSGMGLFPRAGLMSRSATVRQRSRSSRPSSRRRYASTGTCRTVRRTPHRDGRPVVVDRVPEQGRAAYAAEPAPNFLGGLIPTCGILTFHAQGGAGDLEGRSVVAPVFPAADAVAGVGSWKVAFDRDLHGSAETRPSMHWSAPRRPPRTASSVLAQARGSAPWRLRGAPARADGNPSHRVDG